MFLIDADTVRRGCLGGDRHLWLYLQQEKAGQ